MSTGLTIKNALKIFGLCVLIVMSIFFVQVIGYSFEQYVFTTNGYSSQVLMSIFSMLLWASLLFIVVMISPNFRTFFLKWFNTESPKTPRTDAITTDGKTVQADSIRKSKLPLALLLPFSILVAFSIGWFYCFTVGVFNYNTLNTGLILGSIISGMSALLSVAIAVGIFRIQSLENRNQALEQSTLNYINQITGFVYPQWLPVLERDIKEKILTNRYCANRLQQAKNGSLARSQKEIEQDRDEQQQRLMETLSLHDRTTQVTRRLKNGVLLSSVILMLPILFGFLLLMITDSLGLVENFAYVSILVFLCVFGTAILVAIIAGSATDSN